MSETETQRAERLSRLTRALKSQTLKPCSPSHLPMTEHKSGISAELIDAPSRSALQTVVQSARVSFLSEGDQGGERDWKLAAYLARHNHTSPFRHAHYTFCISAPIFLMRQIMKHQVGCSWNERSGRYTQFDEREHWTPREWRTQDKRKQATSAAASSDTASRAQAIYERSMRESWTAYQELIDLGIGREQARAVLPQSTLTSAYLTISLQALAHLLKLREEEHAQGEAQELAHAIRRAFEAHDPDHARLLNLLTT